MSKSSRIKNWEAEQYDEFKARLHFIFEDALNAHCRGVDINDTVNSLRDEYKAVYLDYQQTIDHGPK